MQRSTVDRQARVEALVRYLCSPACAGRAPNTPEGIAARERIVAEFRDAGVAPGAQDGYLQPVPRCGANVLAEHPGSGPLAARAVVVAAHYDHLGKCRDGEAFWGADDNAAAVAILLELARTLVADALPGRRVVLAAYDGEEAPHFLSGTMGSMHHVAHPTVPLSQIDMMVCMDLCGHAIGPAGLPAAVRDSIFVLGAELSDGTDALVEGAAQPGGVYPRRVDLDVIPPLSDYYAFRGAGVPVLFLTCGRWEHYHRVTDTPDRLDYRKIIATADYLARLVQSLRARPDAPVRLHTRRRDDAATVASLLALAELLAPFSAEARGAVAQLEPLAAAAAHAPLSQAHRAFLSGLVHALESALG
ncbi:MAG: M28 family peptidase [Nannocystaceae bacterium]